jgi:glycosyltransferase involved in cell wall biosynthesis
MQAVSVILTTYNSEKSLQRALDSLFYQEGLGKVFSLEVIVIDDCSSDGTKQIIEKNHIPYISTAYNSGGPNKGRNIGLKKASGDYICIMDHDDEWLPDKAIKQLNLSEQAPIISTGYYELNEITGVSIQYVNPPHLSNGYNFYPNNQSFLNHLSRSKKGQKSYIGGLMFHKSLKYIPFEEKYAMVDFDWLLKIFQNQSSLEVCEPLFIRHISGENLSFNESYRINDYNFSKQTLKAFINEYPREVKIASKRINGTMARYYYKMEKMGSARKYFFKSECNLKCLAYFITSFYGYKLVNKKFKVF